MSDCSCIYVETENMPEWCTSRIVKAKKMHQCTECGMKIHKGEKYEYVFGKWDLSTSVYKTCLNCLSVRNEFFCYNWNYTAIWEELAEHIQEGPIESSCIANLTKTARDKVCDMVEESWQEND